MYVTSGNGATSTNSLYKLTDTTGYNSTISITTANNVTLYTAASGAILKGVDFAPVALPTVTLNTANLANNASTLTIAGTNFSTTAANDTVTFSGAGFDRHHRKRDFGHCNLADLHLHTRPHVERAS